MLRIKQINNIMETELIEQSITTYLTPALALLISGVIALWFKELVGDLVASIR